ATIRSDLEAPKIALAPDGTRVAVGDRGRPVTIWDLGEGTLVATLDDPRGAADRLAWSADGALLVTASFGAVNLWDPESRAHVATCAGFRGFPGVVEFSRDAAHLGVGSAEGVWLWETPRCRPSMHYRPEGAIA